MAKNKKSKTQNQKARIRKAKNWVATYKGNNLVHDYGRMFKVDPICAVKDLEAMKASTPEQREFLKQAHEVRVQKEREELTARLMRKLEKKKIVFEKAEPNLSDMKKALKEAKANTPVKKNPKRRCENCGRAMKQQFIGLKHCKCGTSWSKADGYFERSPDMVFALERRVTKKGKNSIRTKQVPVVLYKGQD